MIVRLTVCWRPMCCWLRLKCTGNGDPSKAILWVLSKREEKNFFFKKWTNPGLFFVYFRTFQTNIIKIFTTDQCEKMSCPSSIMRWDLNPQPLECEPPPITSRPWLPPELQMFTLDHRTVQFCLPNERTNK